MNALSLASLIGLKTNDDEFLLRFTEKSQFRYADLKIIAFSNEIWGNLRAAAELNGATFFTLLHLYEIENAWQSLE